MMGDSLTSEQVAWAQTFTGLRIPVAGNSELEIASRRDPTPAVAEGPAHSPDREFPVRKAAAPDSAGMLGTPIAPRGDPRDAGVPDAPAPAKTAFDKDDATITTVMDDVTVRMEKITVTYEMS